MKLPKSPEDAEESEEQSDFLGFFGLLGFFPFRVYSGHMRSLRILSLALLSCTLLGTMTAFAEGTITYDESRLKNLYQEYVRKNNVADTYLQKRIDQERARILTQADLEVKQIVAPATSIDVSDATALPKALDRQTSVVTALQEALRERKVDLDLLREEERKYYLSPDSATGGFLESRLTKTYPELLAKKAILEERIAALDQALPLQLDRQNKLSRQQSLEQFTFLFSFFSYAAIIALGVIVDRILRRMIVGRIGEKGRRYLISKSLTSVIYLLTALWVLSKLFSEHPNAVASLAIIGAGIAVAMQDIVKDVAGWLIILQKRPFALGDRVSIGASTGDVIDIGVLRTTLLEVSTTGAFNSLERTGKTLNVPNSLMLREAVLNYNTTSDFLNAELQVTITYDSDWQKAEKILRELLNAETIAFTEQAKHQQNRRTAHFYSSWEVSEPEVHLDLASSGLLFTLKFTVPIGQRRSVVTRLSHTILERFEAAHIDLAFNTIRVIGGNGDEGKKTPR